MDIEIILPPVSDDEVSNGLRWLTAQLETRLPDAETGYGLGGEHGYGVNYENDTFAMRRYYWGDCDCGGEQRESEWCKAHPHGPDCYQTEMDDEMFRLGGVPSEWGGHPSKPADISYDAWEGMRRVVMDRLCEKHGLDKHFGCMVHCTCGREAAYQEWVKASGCTDTCATVLPNFHHKPSGFTVRWYKYIGRGMEIDGDPGDFRAMLAACLASVPHPHGEALNGTL